MNKIRLHGILAKEFGKTLDLKINNLNFILDAVNVNKEGFRKRVISMQQDGFNYAILVNGKMVKSKNDLAIEEDGEVIDFVPIIAGQGLIVAGAAIAGFGAIAGIGALVTFGLTLAATAIVGALTAPDPPKFEAQEIATRGLDKSFAFANKANLATQGQVVPLAYGRLKIGSNVIQSVIKTYPQNTPPLQAMQRNSYNIYGGKSVAGSQIINY